MSTPTIWEILIVVAVIAPAIWARYALPTYLAEKGKNLASKQDIEELTRKVEGIRSQYLTELERLRFDLERASLMHRARYETEFRVYEEIWQNLVPVQRAVASLRPMFDYADPKETDAERRTRRLNMFGEAFNALQTAIWKGKPFYSAEVHRELQELSRLLHSEAVDYQYGDAHRDEDYWRTAKQNAEAIGKQVDLVCEAIRARLSGNES